MPTESDCDVPVSVYPYMSVQAASPATASAQARMAEKMRVPRRLLMAYLLMVMSC